MPEGFFTFKKSKPRRSALEIKYNTPGEPDCKNCDLSKGCKSPKMKVGGKGKLGIFILCEAPGGTEDTKNDQLVGEVGQHLELKMKVLGIDLHRDCYKLNAINCRPPGNRNPTIKEINCCRPWILKALEEKQPKHLWLMGGSAIDSIYGDRFDNRKITRWRGLHIPDMKQRCWIHPMYHPSWSYRSKTDNNVQSTFDRDLKEALDHYTDPFPKKENYEDKVHLLYKINEVEDILHKVLGTDDLVMAFDYETTGRKPFKPNHRIHCASLSFDDNAYVFVLERPDYWENFTQKKVMRLWRRVLTWGAVMKIAHNVAFEDLWSVIRVGVRPRNLRWCTMNTAHIIDSRQKFTSLKFQTYINFGVEDFKDDMQPYLETDKGVEYNEIQAAPLEGLMLRCGLDSIFTRKLYFLQKEILDKNPELEMARAFYQRSTYTFNNMQRRGIPVNSDYFEQEDKHMAALMKRVDKEIMRSPEAISFRDKTGRPLNHKSSTDLRHLLFTVLKYPPVKKTKKGVQESVDVEVLQEIDTTFTQKVLKHRRTKKIKDTYLAQFLREEYNGRVHPFFNLHIARTYRSSSNNPNVHNIPVREEDAKRACRTGIIPSTDHRFIESDYGSQEVRIAGCYTEDPAWIEYIITPGADMHRDCAAEVFKLESSNVTGVIRFYSKNQWVFPELYGSYYKNCAKNLWQSVVEGGLKTHEGRTVKEHLRSKDIATYSRFEDHCRKYERRYWNRFKKTKEWQEKVVKDYALKGYVTTYFGHRRSGYLSMNEVINTPIQATAFHCLLWSCNRCDDIARQELWVSRLLSQVHDSMKFDAYPPEQEMVVETIRQVAEKDIRDEFDWIIVPLVMDFEFTPINGNWYIKEAVEMNENGDFVGMKSGKIYDLNY